jgi:DNA-binding transcriptional regulator YdaS (Cro superfamily)
MSKNVEMQEAARRAIAEVGGVTAMARFLGIKHPSVSRWRRVPAERVRAIAKRTKIPGYILRPDIYDRPSTPAR